MPRSFAELPAITYTGLRVQSFFERQGIEATNEPLCALLGQFAPFGAGMHPGGGAHLFFLSGTDDGEAAALIHHLVAELGGDTRDVCLDLEGIE